MHRHPYRRHDEWVDQLGQIILLVNRKSEVQIVVDEAFRLQPRLEGNRFVGFYWLFRPQINFQHKSTNQAHFA